MTPGVCRGASSTGKSGPRLGKPRADRDRGGARLGLGADPAGHPSRARTLESNRWSGARSNLPGRPPETTGDQGRVVPCGGLRFAPTPAKGGQGQAAGKGAPRELASPEARAPQAAFLALGPAGRARSEGNRRLASPRPGPVQPAPPAPPRRSRPRGLPAGARGAPGSPWGPRGARAGRSTSWCGYCGPRRRASRSAGRS